MNLHALLSDHTFLAIIIQRAAALRSEHAGKVVVELNLKDGRWGLGNVSVMFARPPS